MRQPQVDLGDLPGGLHRRVISTVVNGQAQSLAYRGKRMLPARERLAGQFQDVGHAFRELRKGGLVEPRQFHVQKSRCERGEIHEDGGTLQIRLQLFGHGRKDRFVAQKPVGDPMHREGVLLDGATRIQVEMLVMPREFAIPQFDAGDFDDAIASPGGHAGGVNLQTNMAAHARTPSAGFFVWRVRVGGWSGFRIEPGCGLLGHQGTCVGGFDCVTGIP